MSPPTVLYVSGFEVADAWRAEIERIFGPGVKVVRLSPVGLTPTQLVQGRPPHRP